jgi:hypothetical protein
MREIRQSGSEGGEPQSNAASLPLSSVGCILAVVSLSHLW